jgi:hypothetical protein
VSGQLHAPEALSKGRELQIPTGQEDECHAEAVRRRGTDLTLHAPVLRMHKKYREVPNFPFTALYFQENKMQRCGLLFEHMMEII